jgi:hypothetical protein
MKTATLVAFTFALGIGCGPAWSQTANAPSSNAQSAATQNCPPTVSGEMTGHKGGEEPPQRQPIEHSAILPDATQQGQSAAPTVQQSGKDVVAQTDCPKPPNRIDAPKTQ